MTLRLKAFVRGSTGGARHCTGTIVDGKPVAASDLPNPEWLEISEEAGGFFLFHFSSDGVCVADTWHATVSEAKDQAQHEFDISSEDWIETFENIRAT